ncbi:secreted antigen 1 [Babesia divergens]|uniref:Secreted antigen 1 n=1 Tax=Babesia divergens TaxID=32595 RepID=A0AAD9G7H4_BABDI|nr:secreted antigen 1 [Babesia divergens]
MSISTVFRAAVLAFLAVGIGGPNVDCGFVEGPLTDELPGSLKDMLDFFGMLHSNTNVMEKVLEKINSKVGTYFTAPAVPQGQTDGNLKKTFKAISELRTVLLKAPTAYGQYSTLYPTVEYAEKYATTLINWLPILHSELYALYFQTATEAKSLGGMGWPSQNIVHETEESNLYKWLLLKKFEKGILKEGRFAPSDATHTGINVLGGGPLNHSQYGLFFLRPAWHGSNLANAVLFVNEFCQEINKDHGVISKEDLADHATKGPKVADVCKKISENLKTFNERLMALYNPPSPEEQREENNAQDVNRRLYEGKLQRDVILDYVHWLGKNLPHIRKSLKQLYDDSAKWTKSNLMDGVSSGPFKYGFVFTDDQWDGAIQGGIKKAVDDLIGSFGELLQSVDPSVAVETIQIQPSEDAQTVNDGQGIAQGGSSAGEPSRVTEPSSQVPKQEQGQVNPSTGTTTQDQATEAPASGAGAASTAGAEGVQSEESRETSGGDSKEPANLRPAGGESKPKGSSFTSTPFVGCFVTLGFLISMI